MPEILVVCYGNICRSPMAETLLRASLDRRLGLGNPFSVSSAGVGAYEGNPAPAPAQAAMARRGLDVSGHRSRQLTPALVLRADLVVCMTEEHRRRSAGLAPWATGKVVTLGEDVPDPLGGTEEDYERVARFLEPRIEELAGRIAGGVSGLTVEGETRA